MEEMETYLYTKYHKYCTATFEIGWTLTDVRTHTHTHMHANFTDKVYFRNMKETKQKLIDLLFMIQSFLSNCTLFSLF
jgi:hypothetical protein